MRHLFFVLIFISVGCRAELLTPKRRSPSPKRIETIEDHPPLPETRAYQKPDFTYWPLTLFAGTPLGSVSTYDARFTTFVIGTDLGFPLAFFSDDTTLFGSVGFALSVSRLTLSQPKTSFTHTYFHFPVVLRLRQKLNEEWSMEGFGGFSLRPWESDSRNTPDGGIHSVSDVSVIQPEVGVGLQWHFLESMAARLSASYLWLTAGIRFEL